MMWSSRRSLAWILVVASVLFTARPVVAEGLTLEARVVGIDGKPVPKSSITIWRLVPEGERKAKEADEKLARAMWRESGKVWESLGGASTDDHYRREGLTPGTYRFTAVLDHHQATPVGVSEAVTIHERGKQTTVTVRLGAGPKLTIRPVDLEGDRPLTNANVRLEREGDAYPPSWSFYGAEKDGRITIDHLPPGTYRVVASRRASRPEDLEFEATEEGRKVVVEAGVDREFRVPMRGRPLGKAEIDRRWGWVAEGRVTNAAGLPIAGAEIHIATGWGTLRGGGRTMTDAQGRFTLRFGEGWWSNDEVNGQSAIFFVSKPGYVEASRSQPGNHLMARAMPKEERRHGIRPGKIILPGKAHQIDFVLTEPAVLETEVVGAAGGSLSVESVKALEIGLAQSAESGGPRRWNLLPGRPLRFTLPYGKDRFSVRSLPFTLPEAGRYRATVRYTPDKEWGVDRLDIVSLTGPDGEEIAEEIVGDDPLARPAVEQQDQKKGRDILRAMARANRLWLGEAQPEGVDSYEYRLKLANRDGTIFKVEKGTPGTSVIRRGISYHSAMHQLAADPESAAFRMVEVGDERIRLAYTFRDPIGIAVGNGIRGTWLGFFSLPIREGILTLDSRRLTPLENRTEEVTETFSQYLEAGRGSYVPLAIHVSRRNMKFDWTFQVFEPGLWLFAKSRYANGEGPAGPVADLDQVRVNGAEGKRKALGERPPE